jgi:glutathione S-transferase
MKLYGLSRSVYTRTARLALEEKGVGYELCEVEIFGEHGVPPEHYARHPFGRIPVLEHDGFMLFEKDPEWQEAAYLFALFPMAKGSNS